LYHEASYNPVEEVAFKVDVLLASAKTPEVLSCFRHLVLEELKGHSSFGLQLVLLRPGSYLNVEIDLWVRRIELWKLSFLLGNARFLLIVKTLRKE
jgi:hypothetical protein